MHSVYRMRTGCSQRFLPIDQCVLSLQIDMDMCKRICAQKRKKRTLSPLLLSPLSNPESVLEPVLKGTAGSLPVPGADVVPALTGFLGFDSDDSCAVRDDILFVTV